MVLPSIPNVLIDLLTIFSHSAIASVFASLPFAALKVLFNTFLATENPIICCSYLNSFLYSANILLKVSISGVAASNSVLSKALLCLMLKVFFVASNIIFLSLS